MRYMVQKAGRQAMALVGYARVSSVGQSLDVQLDKLKDCRKIFREKKSGTNDKRPQLAACLEYVREGDAAGPFGAFDAPPVPNCRGTQTQRGGAASAGPAYQHGGRDGAFVVQCESRVEGTNPKFVVELVSCNWNYNSFNFISGFVISTIPAPN